MGSKANLWFKLIYSRQCISFSSMALKLINSATCMPSYLYTVCKHVIVCNVPNNLSKYPILSFFKSIMLYEIYFIFSKPFYQSLNLYKTFTVDFSDIKSKWFFNTFVSCLKFCWIILSHNLIPQYFCNFESLISSYIWVLKYFFFTHLAYLWFLRYY